MIKLDYSLQTPEERNQLVNQILSEADPEELTPKYLEILADYLILCMEKQEKKQKKILTENRLTTVNKRETSFEGMISQMEMNEDGIYNLITQEADEYEKITARTLPDTPELTVDADKNAVELSWNKVQGATGYVVYYSPTKNGTYKKLATVKGTSCRTEKFNEDDNCYFKIRAYVKVSDSNVYSAYSVQKGIAK